jgi:alkylation response protein AidB-like acyl-CoA dehydrogenase
VADEVWCELFSEPAAGSDLAAVRARATQHANGSFVVNGQKVWTTHAHFAQFGLLLARTDDSVPKHKGLTAFIVPMDLDGVTVRPLRQISGDAEFNEVFLDEVRLDAHNVLGSVGNGWSVMLAVLMFERFMISLNSDRWGYRADRFALALASAPGAVANDEIRHRFGEVASDLIALRFGNYRTLSALRHGHPPGPESALAKITMVRAATAATDLVVDVLGLGALGYESEWADATTTMPGLKSAGGTEEILRNTVGERVLGLPGEPRVDKDVPFSQLSARSGG